MALIASRTFKSIYLLLLMFVKFHTAPAQGFFGPNRRSRENQIFRRVGIRPTMFNYNDASNGKTLVTNLDNLRELFVIARHMTLQQANNNIDELYRSNRAKGKMQKRMPLTAPFPCNLTNGRSAEPPTSINRLRPGDIDVIASLGDSLSAGNGVISESIVHILNEFRGISFAGGGLGTWRDFLTLPNILKAYNPNLYGYSIEEGLVVDRVSRLNIAEPMIMSRDLPFQAQVVVDRMRRDPNIDMTHHWKLLTIFTGNNDICSDMCHHQSITDFIQRHERDLRRTLTILRENVPRLLVNLVPVPNMVTTLYPMKNIPLLCQVVHLVGCHCIFSERIKEPQLKRASRNIARWQAVEEYVASLPEFNTENFAVVYQPFTANVTTPTHSNGDTDLRYFASDCFHFSQLGHAAMANGLWNNMLEPVGQKKMEEISLKDMKCPTAQRPYIATLNNS